MNTSIQVGPSVISDGLIAFYDAASVRSYKGEPTENLVSQPLNPDSWSGNTDTDFGFISRETINTPYGPGLRWIVEGTAYQSTLLRIGTGSRLTVTPGMYYTSSLYARTPDRGNVTFALQGRDSNGDRADGSSGVYSLTDEWTRISRTWSMDDFNLADIDAYMKLYLRGPSTSDLGVVEIACPQVELKPYATPFTTTSRNNYINNLVGPNQAYLHPNITTDSRGRITYTDDITYLLRVYPQNLNMQMRNETISFWAKCDLDRSTVGGGGFTNRIIHWGQYGQNNSGGFGVQNGVMRFYVRGGIDESSWTSNPVVHAANSIYDENKFNLYTLQFINNNTIRLYIDGNEMITFTLNDPFTGYDTNALDFGLNMDMTLGEVKVWNRVLQPFEIQREYESLKSRYIN